MKVGDYVEVCKGEFSGRKGCVDQVRVHDISYTSFTLLKIVFCDDSSVFWVNQIYVKRSELGAL